MKKTWKRGLSLAMALTMAFSLINITALATEEANEPVHLTSTCPACNGAMFEPADCPTCNGTGEVDGEIRCTACSGKGYTISFADCENCGHDGFMDDGSQCPECGGGGSFISHVPCNECGESGKIMGKIPCSDACNGSGKILTDTPCGTCGGTGEVDCSGTFGAGVLTAVAADTGIGTLTHTCPDCGAAYTEELDAPTTAATLAEGLSITLSTETAAIAAGAKQTVSYRLTIKNNNPVDVANVQLTVMLPQSVVLSGKPSVSGAVTTVDESKSIATIAFSKIQKNASKSGSVKAVFPDDSVAGTDYTVLVTGALQIGSTGETAPLSGASAAIRVNKYAASTVYLCGAKLGFWYGENVPNTGWDESRRNLAATLDDYEGKTLSFEAAFNKDDHPDTGIYSKDPTHISQTVINQNTGLSWTCVGFVPFDSAPGPETMLRHVYTDSESPGPFTQGSLEDAKAAVTSANGILYGETATEAHLASFTKDQAAFVCVWYVQPVQPLEKGQYDDLSTPLLTNIVPNAANYAPSSAGVSVSCGEPQKTAENMHGNTKIYYDVDLTVTIAADASGDLHVNLTEAIAQANYAILTRFSSLEPGDTIRYHITVVNNSGKNYTAADSSAAIGTVPPVAAAGQSIHFTGFDGYEIPLVPVSEDPDPLDSASKSYIPWRVYNVPLQELGVQVTGGRPDLSDAHIGALLKGLGYGEDEELTDEQITRKYLSHYYLDYLNQFSGEAPVTSFAALSDTQLRLLTDCANFMRKHEVESCVEVAQALYCNYYARVFLFNGVSLYDQMQNNSRLGADFAAAFAAGEKFTLTASLDSFLMANGFQETRLGFGMQFDLSYPSDPTPPVFPPDTPPTTPPTVPPTVPEEPPEQPGPSVEEIPEEQPPLAENPAPTPAPELPVEEIVEEEVPMAEAPKTGDSLVLWAVLSALSGMGLLGLALTGRRRRDGDA